jgi:acyl carrier protein
VTDISVIIGRLQALFVECFHIEVPSPDTDLLETGILDSLQFVELLAQLEQRYGLKVQLDAIDIEDLRTLARIARLMSSNGACEGAPAPRPAAAASG